MFKDKAVALMVLTAALLLLFVLSYNLPGWFIDSSMPVQRAETCLQEKNVDPALIQKFLKGEDIGQSEFLIFSKYDNENVRYFVAANIHAGADILSSLADDKSELVLQGLVGNPNISDATFDALLQHPSLLKYLIQNKSLSEERLLSIYHQCKDVPLASFALRPDCPEEIKIKIIESDQGKYYLLKQTKLKAKICLQEENVDAGTIERFLDGKDIGQDHFLTFSKHNNENVRFWVAANPYTGTDILDNLVHDSSFLVLFGLTKNSNISRAALDVLLQHESLWKYLAGNPRMSEEKLLDIYHRSKGMRLYYFAINLNCPEEIKKDIRKSNDEIAKNRISYKESIKKDGERKDLAIYE